MQILNMLGQPCPIPVISAKKALALPGAQGVEVQVDNMAAVQNLEKMANGLGYSHAYTQTGDSEYLVTIGLNGAPPPKNTIPAPVDCPPLQAAALGGLTVLLTANQMGSGSEELGRILIKGFLFSLSELPIPPENVIFLNSAAQLTTEGANTLDDLRALAAKGTGIYTCGTCLNYYGITEKLAVGEVTDMMGITTRLAAAGKLVTL